jgi:hypothetical protein
MKALRRSVGASEQARASKPSKKPRKEATGGGRWEKEKEKLAATFSRA